MQIKTKLIILILINYAVFNNILSVEMFILCYKKQILKMCYSITHFYLKKKKRKIKERK